MSLNKKDKNKINNSYKKYIDESTYKELQKGINIKSRDFEKKKVQYILLNIKDLECNTTFFDNLESVIELLLQYKARITNVFNSILLVYFDITNIILEDVINSIFQHNNEIRICYGEENVLIGNYGGKRRVAYGPVFNNFSSKIKILLSLKYGERKRL